MSRARSHAKNMIALLASSAFARGLSLVALAISFKALSQEENGVLQFCLRAGYLFALFTEFGIRGYLVRELARVRGNHELAQDLFARVWNARLLLVLPVLLLNVVTLSLLQYDGRTVWLSVALFVYYVLDSFAILIKFAFRAYEQMWVDAVFSTLGRSLLVAGLVSLWFSGTLTLERQALVYIASSGVEFIALGILLWRRLHLSLFVRSHVHAMMSAVRTSIPFAVVNIIGTLYLSTGTFVLSKLLGDTAVASYNAAARLPEAAQFIPTAIVNALIPFLSRHHADRGVVGRYSQLLVRYCGYAGVALAAVFVAEPLGVIHLFAKKEYEPVAYLFRYFGLWAVLVFYQIVGANVLICLNREKVVMMRALLALITNVVLNFLLVEHYGLEGSAIALVCSEVISCGLYAWVLWREGIPMRLSTLLEIGIVGTLMAGTMLALPNELPSLGRMIAGLAVGGAVVGVLVIQRDGQLLRRIFIGGQADT
ncbi:MAG: hypothetical protein KatS3mg130_2053 [Candidatus Sumerlaea sp.]|uniref:Uncharacterized protein n=1 Tax=Sumerlaea chitinivorans TaxID=2250252 RepID=A0A2Z4Y4I7_SUMC1|nr:hypothetical protein BRCON_1344 [Candidatus Sumerlaea chitinivorans]MCX7964483.1 oligosaccharide flippase family protein [Candidatus Sumerlaea chitinivorans]GIX45645.1 MAG: hypothetical protein KatS3mg130_2053 [Candidatus Sumerlaea sp.]